MARWLAGGVVVSGILVLVAWSAGLVVGTSLLPGFPRMCRTTATGFVVAGLSLWLLSASRSAPAMRLPGILLAAVPLLLGGLVLGEHLLGPISETLSLSFGGTDGADSDGGRARVAVSTAVSFILSGAALLLLDWEGRRGFRPAQHLALATLVVAAISLTGYVLNAPLAHSYFFTGMALNTSFTFLLLGTGILLVRPDTGPMSVLTSRSVGGVMLRRLLPPLVLVPPFLGWLEIELQTRQVLSYEIVEPISAVLGAAVAAAIVWMFARALNKEDGERRAYESALEESEANFRALSESAHDGIIVAVGDDARYVFVNPQFAKMMGHAVEELLGRSFRDFIAPEEAGKIAARYARWKAGEPIPPRHETMFVRKDGSRLPVEVTDAPLTWKGEPGVFAIVRDVAERKRMETAVSEALARFEAVIRHTPLVAIQGFDRDGTILHWNGASERLYGYAEHEALGGRLENLLLDEDAAGEFKRTLSAVWESGRATDPAEWKVRTRSGEERWVYSTIFPVVLSGEVSEAFCMDVDVTERRRSEAALRESEANFRALADNANDSIIVAVEPGIHVFANRLAAEMIGYTVEELLSLSPREVLHPDEVPKIMERFRKRLAGESVPGRYESVLRHKDGHYIPVEVTVARTTWRRRPANIVVTRDITQRKGDEEERAALYQQNRALLRQLLYVQEEERKRLAQEIHDDLGQALTAIMTNARVIAKNCPQCQPEYVEAAEEIVSIAAGVYDSVQRISRRLRPSALDDLGLMDALRAMVESSQLKKAGVDFTISFGGEVNALEDSVKIAVYRILQECLTNIAKHSGADHVTISLERTPGGTAKGETVELVIEDNGRGIPPPAATRGLGLIGIRERVETLGGEFRLLSGPGKGTSVHAALPVSRAMAQPMERTGA